MKISIICVGKIKEKFYREALAEYVKRLSRYTKVDIIEVEDEKTVENASEALEEQIKKKEADKIIEKIKKDAYVITLEILGEKMNSVKFSKTIERASIEGRGHIQFIIGGSLGLHESISALANKKISFSDMTFPHQLMRVILTEQIYRAYRISNNEPYHK